MDFLTVIAVLLATIVIAISIYQIVGTWKIFSKAGKPGWASIIPIYNIYVKSNIVFGNLSYFIAIMVLWVVTLVGRFSDIGSLSYLVSLASLALHIVYSIKLAKAFEKSGGFAVGLVLLTPIFISILGFDSSKYIGPQKLKTQDESFL